MKPAGAGAVNWLWAFATPATTVYAICPGRGFDDAATILGADFDGVLVRDGWAPYRRFTNARHQSCLAHCSAGVVCSTPTIRGAPAARVQAVLTDALALRRRDAQAITDQGLAVAQPEPAHRHGARPARGPALRGPSRRRVPGRARLPVGPRRGRDQLARRTRHPPRRRQARSVAGIARPAARGPNRSSRVWSARRGNAIRPRRLFTTLLRAPRPMVPPPDAVWAAGQRLEGRMVETACGRCLESIKQRSPIPAAADALGRRVHQRARVV